MRTSVLQGHALARGAVRHHASLDHDDIAFLEGGADPRGAVHARDGAGLLNRVREQQCTVRRAASAIEGDVVQAGAGWCRLRAAVPSLR